MTDSKPKSRFGTASDRATERPMEGGASLDAELVRSFFDTVGMPWPARTTLRSNVTQSSFRLTLDMAEALKNALPFRHTVADLHGTIAALYITDTATPGGLRARVDELLAQKAKGVRTDLYAERLAAYLEELNMPWHSRTPLRNQVTQTSFRFTTSFADTLKKTVPITSAVAEMHIITSAMYLSDPAFKARIDAVLRERAGLRAE